MLGRQNRLARGTHVSQCRGHTEPQLTYCFFFPWSHLTSFAQWIRHPKISSY
jgi:hypothetical protein